MTRRMTFPQWCDWSSVDTLTISSYDHPTKLEPGPLGRQGLIPGPFVQGQHLNRQLSSLSHLTQILSFWIPTSWTLVGEVETADGVPCGMLSTGTGPQLLLNDELNAAPNTEATVLRPGLGSLLGLEAINAEPALDWYVGSAGASNSTTFPSFDYAVSGTQHNVGHVVRMTVTLPNYSCEVWTPTTSVPLAPGISSAGRWSWGNRQTVTLASSSAMAILPNYDWVRKEYYWLSPHGCWGGLSLPGDAAAGTISATESWLSTGDPLTSYTAPNGRTVAVFATGTACTVRYTDDTGGAWTLSATSITCGSSTTRFNVWYAEGEWFLWVPTSTANDARLYVSADNAVTWTAVTTMDTVNDYGLGSMQTDAGVVIGSLWVHLMRSYDYPGLLIVDGPRRRMWFEQLAFVDATSWLWADRNALMITTVISGDITDTIQVWRAQCPLTLPSVSL